MKKYVQRTNHIYILSVEISMQNEIKCLISLYFLNRTTKCKKVQNKNTEKETTWHSYLMNKQNRFFFQSIHGKRKLYVA